MNISFKRKGHPPQPGSIIEGKWNGKAYSLLRTLGSGENGTVYLVQAYGQQYALKMSLEAIDLSYEIQVIQQLNEAQGSSLGLSVFDIDDFTYMSNKYSFYVMPYQKGVPLDKYLYGKNEIDYYHIFIRVIKLLDKIHREGWTFGDLKPEHILIDSVSDRISFIDLGGITRFGEGVRQYTELYDRGAWRAGNRSADPHYDYFSLAMIFIQMGLGINKLLQIHQQSRSVSRIYDIIRKIPTLQILTPILTEILTGSMLKSSDILAKLEENASKINYRKYRVGTAWIDWLFTSSSILFISMVLFFIYHW